jgi:hypothetical protein
LNKKETDAIIEQTLNAMMPELKLYFRDMIHKRLMLDLAVSQLHTSILRELNQALWGNGEPITFRQKVMSVKSRIRAGLRRLW